MFIGIVISPNVFCRECINNEIKRFQAEQLLDAIRDNGIIIVDEINEYRNHLRSALNNLAGSEYQHIRIPIEYIVTNDLKRFCAPLPNANHIVSGNDVVEHLIHIASIMNPNIVVCASSNERDQVKASLTDNIEVVELLDYSRSESEKKRKLFKDGCNIADLDQEGIREYVGGALRYTRNLTIADGFFGSDARSSTATKNGIVFLVDKWLKFSPYSNNSNLQIDIYTLGAGGSIGTLLNVTQLKKDIEEQYISLLKEEFGSKILVVVKLIFKDDRSTPRRFQQRYMMSCRRCFQIEHGIRTFGLFHSGQEVEHVVIQGPSQTNLDAMNRIMRLDNSINI